MATTVSYAASLCTRKYTSSANAKSSAACQEFYDSNYNYVGIISFSGMNLANKVITGIWLDIDAAKAGYGAGSTKTVFLRKANYQNGIASGVAGWEYTGDELGTFDGSFYGNYTSYYITGSLFNAMAAYIAAGNNSFTIYNPYASASSHGYSFNYMQLESVVITVTYEEAVSQPTVSSSSVNLGTALTIYTNRQSTATVHTISYWFGETSGAIATNVGASVSWTPPLSLASQIPNATSGICTITCNSFVNGTLTGTRTCTVTLTVPSTVVPSISSVTVEDTNETVVTKIGAYVKSLSTLSVAITAAGIYGSTISSYRTSLDGVTYTAASFTASKKLSAAGDMTMTVTVTDSRGRTVTYTNTFNVLDYAVPSIKKFSAERCNSDGSAAQVDGTKVRFSFTGSVNPLNNKNGLSCLVYYKLKSATAWTQAYKIAITSYNLSATNQLLEQTYDALYSYDLKVRLTDYFYYVEQAVSIGTKGVILDFMADGTGIGIGKVAETSGYIDCGWPLKLSTALAVAYGGTGAASAAGAIANLGGVKKTGDTMTGNLNISGYLYPSMLLLPTYNDTTNRTVFEGSYAGASSFAAWEDSTGNNRRMLEVRTKAYQNSLDWAVLLRVCDAGTWGNYRVFHSGMVSGVPVANGGTGATTAANARANLGANNAGNLTTGTLPTARLPFKYAYGSTSINGSSATYVDYSSAGFTSTPVVLVTYSTTAGNWSGDNGAIKVHSKTPSGCYIVVGGNFSTSRNVDWFAFGV
ncbi:MAG: DUF859 family phage minor structural protein [Bacillota bacterium]|jgi:hypothetical protein|nr:DUF859 family phage minor structural protein [Bacillota bacterium]